MLRDWKPSHTGYPNIEGIFNIGGRGPSLAPLTVVQRILQQGHPWSPAGWGETIQMARLMSLQPVLGGVGCPLVAFSCKTEAPRRWPTDIWTKVSKKISIDFLLSLLLATSSWSCWAWSLRFILEFGSIGFAFCIIVLYQYMPLPLAASACTLWFELVKLWFSTRYAWVWSGKRFPWNLLTAYSWYLTPSQDWFSPCSPSAASKSICQMACNCAFKHLLGMLFLGMRVYFGKFTPVPEHFLWLIPDFQ